MTGPHLPGAAPLHVACHVAGDGIGLDACLTLSALSQQTNDLEIARGPSPQILGRANLDRGSVNVIAVRYSCQTIGEEGKKHLSARRRSQDASLPVKYQHN